MRFFLFVALAVATSRSAYPFDEFTDVPIAPPVAESVQTPAKQADSATVPTEPAAPEQVEALKANAPNSEGAPSARPANAQQKPVASPASIQVANAPTANSIANTEDVPAVPAVPASAGDSTTALTPALTTNDTQPLLTDPVAERGGQAIVGNTKEQRIYPKGFFSPTLGARFVLQVFHVPALGDFYGVRITSEPVAGSPLRQIGLARGDVITRLDGVPVYDLYELEIHARKTEVRFLKEATEVVQAGFIDIDEFHYFTDSVEIRPNTPNCREANAGLLP